MSAARECRRALLLSKLAAGNKTVRECAAELGISERSAYAYLDPETRSLLASMMATLRRDVLTAARDRMLEMLNHGLDKLFELLDSEDERIRLLAVKELLDRVLPGKTVERIMHPVTEQEDGEPTVEEKLHAYLAYVVETGKLTDPQHLQLYHEYQAELARARQDVRCSMPPDDFLPHCTDEKMRLDMWRDHLYPTLATFRFKLLRVVGGLLCSQPQNVEAIR